MARGVCIRMTGIRRLGVDLTICVMCGRFAADKHKKEDFKWQNLQLNTRMAKKL